MNKYLLPLLFLSSFMLNSCFNNDMNLLGISEQDSVLLLNADIYHTSFSDLSVESHFIEQDVAICFAQKLFPSRSITSATAECYEDMIVLYVINFDRGWTIISSDNRTKSILLAYGDDGCFECDSINSPELLFWYNSLKRYVASVILNDSDVSTKARDEYVPYYWAKIKYAQDVSGNTESIIDRLTYTRWGQSFPWNYYCPSFNGQKCFTGCVATAMSQIMYSVRAELNVPNALYETINPQYQQYYDYYLGYDYWIISSLNSVNLQAYSSKWFYMPLIKSNNSYVTTGESYVAELMSTIGDAVGMSYYPFGSGAIPTKTAFSTFELTCDSLDHYDFDIVKESLSSYSPVMISAGSNLGRHAWIIDGFRDSESYITHTYLWKIVPSDSLATVNAVQLYTEEEKQALYPDIEEYDIMEEKEVLSHIKLLRMNWGYDSSTNDIALTSNSWYFSIPYWNYNDVPLSENPIIFYNFNEL